jgi:predicted RNA-binding Zn ribbon-like protein
MSDFRFGLGHVTLDFLATLGGRTGNRIERLAAPRDLSLWIAEAGIAGAPRASRELLDDARELREAIRRLLDCAREGGSPSAADLRLVNEWARNPVPRAADRARLRARVGRARSGRRSPCPHRAGERRTRDWP